VAYGAYLAGPLGHCIECHSTPNDKGIPDFEGKTGGGGLSFNGPWGISYAPNITPTGIGKWSDSEIKTAITTGVRPDGIRLKPPMGYAYYRGIRRADLDAIVAYLRTLKPL
jgi:mono/diheme cytochrome c family protein